MNGSWPVPGKCHFKDSCICRPGASPIKPVIVISAGGRVLVHILRKYLSALQFTQNGPSAETSWSHGRNGREVLRRAVAALVLVIDRRAVVGIDADRCVGGANLCKLGGGLS